MLRVCCIPAFNDNYIFAIVHPELAQCYLIDPGDARPAAFFLQQHHYELKGILLTHHHADHIGGVDTLIAQHECPVYGPHSRAITQVTRALSDADTIIDTDFNLELKVLEVPGHTLDHIAYYNSQWLFCGDTLFVGGCGRVFEGTMEQMFQSLMRLKALPEHIEVYCAHEYTQSNLAFAITQEPENLPLRQRKEHVDHLRARGMSTVPSTIALEKATNPFLRAADAATFAQRRRAKDQA